MGPRDGKEKGIQEGEQICPEGIEKNLGQVWIKDAKKEERFKKEPGPNHVECSLDIMKHVD